MTEIIAVCAISIAAFVFSLTIKQVNPVFSLVIIIIASVIILVYILAYLTDVIDYVTLLFQQVNINSDYIKILLKCTGICFITEFACDLCKESGYCSLSSQISLAGKLITLVMAIPLFKEVLKISLSLAGVQ
jgi:stage III sporulation protein AD